MLQPKSNKGYYFYNRRKKKDVLVCEGFFLEESVFLKSQVGEKIHLEEV